MRKPTKSEQQLEDWLRAHRMIPDDLDAVANRLIGLYVERRRKAFPNYRYQDTEDHRQLWRRAATLVIDNGLEPAAFVLTQFEIHGDMPYLTTFASMRAVDAYWAKVNNADTHTRVELELSLADKKVENRITVLQQPLAQILVDVNNSFSPVFVYCMAVINGLPDIAQVYRQRALEMLNNPHYRRVYAQAFPGVFANVVNQ